MLSPATWQHMAEPIWGPGQRVVEHRRSPGRDNTELKLQHYLDALARKPFAVTHAVGSPAFYNKLPEVGA